MFPTLEGWFKFAKLMRDDTWHYMRLNTDGTLHVEHFCATCEASYQGLTNYFGIGLGTVKGIVILFHSKELYLMLYDRSRLVS